MMHAIQSVPRGTQVRGRPAKLAALVCMLVLPWALPGCGGDGGPLPDNLREGQIGEVQLTLDVPLGTEGDGALKQVLTWNSSGAWTLQEQILYRGLLGDETVEHSPAEPSIMAGAYASFITIINEVEGLELFSLPDSLLSADTEPVPPCGVTRTRITLSVYDEPRDRSTSWIQCADGSLTNLSPVGAGPDLAASRVVSAGIQMRDEIFGPDFLSHYHGSVPFGTLDRGEDSKAPLTAPFYLHDDAAWNAFWQSHAGNATPPVVDFDTEMVVVAAVGQRDEAGDSVEVRRILRVDEGTLTFVLERTPGDFCSPAARSHVPFHIVVAPRTPTPYRFADIDEERVSCGR